MASETEPNRKIAPGGSPPINRRRVLKIALAGSAGALGTTAVADRSAAVRATDRGSVHRMPGPRGDDFYEKCYCANASHAWVIFRDGETANQYARGFYAEGYGSETSAEELPKAGEEPEGEGENAGSESSSSSGPSGSSSSSSSSASGSRSSGQSSNASSGGSSSSGDSSTTSGNVLSGSGGSIEDDSGLSGHCYCKSVSEEAYNRSIKAANNWKTEYKLLTRNCVDYVEHVAAAEGTELPATDGYLWPSNPESFRDSIKARDGESPDDDDKVRRLQGGELLASVAEDLLDEPERVASLAETPGDGSVDEILLSATILRGPGTRSQVPSAVRGALTGQRINVETEHATVAVVTGGDGELQAVTEGGVADPTKTVATTRATLRELARADDIAPVVREKYRNGEIEVEGGGAMESLLYDGVQVGVRIVDTCRSIVDGVVRSVS